MLTGNKDIDLYEILMPLDDESLLNFCKTTWKNEYSRKLCKNEDFWRNRFYNKYGDFEKNPNRTWKKFYLGIIELKKFSVDEVIKELSKNKSQNYDLIKVFEVYKSFSKVGFNKGLFLKPFMISFLKKANFGPKIHSLIDPLLDKGILSRHILTNLFQRINFKDMNDLFEIEDSSYRSLQSVISKGIIIPPYTFKEKRFLFSPEIDSELNNVLEVLKKEKL